MENEKTELENSNSKTEESVREFKVSKKKSVKLKHEGISKDFEDAIEGKEVGKFKKKALYSETDTVEDMEYNTVELLADSSRKLIKRAEKSENEKIKELVNKEYAPSSTEDENVDEEELLRSALNIF